MVASKRSNYNVTCCVWKRVYSGKICVYKHTTL